MVGSKPVLKIAIVNLMPNKQETERQLLNLLEKGNIPLNIDFIHMESHRSKNTSHQYLKQHYKVLSQIQSTHYDGLIVTGAPVEKLPFEEVTYWEELCQLFDWANTHVTSSMYICWGAQAALSYYYQIGKSTLSEKISGVYAHDTLHSQHPLTKDLPSGFLAPHSRWTTIDERAVAKEENLDILAASSEAGLHIVADKQSKHLFLLGHMEYEADTLAKEYFRDRGQGLAPILPVAYFPNDDPSEAPINKWATYGGKLFANWIRHLQM